MVSDLLKTYSPDALRLYLAPHHYLEAWSYAEKDLQKFQELAARLKQTVQMESGKNASFSQAEYSSRFSESMENDLGTPGAVHVLEGLAQAILDATKGQGDVTEAQTCRLSVTFYRQNHRLYKRALQQIQFSEIDPLPGSFLSVDK